MDSAVETMGDEVASQPLRPVVAVTVAALCTVDGKLLTLLRDPDGTSSQAVKKGDSGPWELPLYLPSEGTSLEEAARKAVAPWIGPGVTHVEQLHAWHVPGSRSQEPRLEVAYLALTTPLAMSRGHRGGPGSSHWEPMDELPLLPATHLRVLERARERLQDRLNYTNVACRLLPPEFSLSELQQVYEAVQSKELDKRNFRKWVLGNRLVEPTLRHRRDGAHRPARLYRATHPELTQLGS